MQIVASSYYRSSKFPVKTFFGSLAVSLFLSGGGILAIITCNGVNLGALNALRHLSFAGKCGVPLIVGVVYFAGDCVIASLIRCYFHKSPNKLQTAEVEFQEPLENDTEIKDLSLIEDFNEDVNVEVTRKLQIQIRDHLDAILHNGIRTNREKRPSPLKCDYYPARQIKDHPLHIVFSFPDTGLIFKIYLANPNSKEVKDQEHANGKLKARYDTIQKGQTVVDEQKLDTLYIPKCSLFYLTVDEIEYAILAEEKLEIDVELSHQKELFMREVTEAHVGDMTKFILAMNASDVNPGNFPAFYKDEELYIACLDFEETKKEKGAEVGLIGKVGEWGKVIRTGLLEFVYPEHVAVIRDLIADQHEDFRKHFETAAEKRALSPDAQYRTVTDNYEQRGIKGGELLEKVPRGVEYKKKLDVSVGQDPRMEEITVTTKHINMVITAINNEITEKAKKKKQTLIARRNVTVVYKVSRKDEITWHEFQTCISYLLDNNYIYSAVRRPNCCEYQIQV